MGLLITKWRHNFVDIGEYSHWVKEQVLEYVNTRWMLHFFPNIELFSRSNNTVMLFCRHDDLSILLYHITSQGFFFLNYVILFLFFFSIRVMSSSETHSTQIFLFILFMQVCFHGDNAGVHFHCSSRQSFICGSTTQINFSAYCDSPKVISSPAISKVPFHVFIYTHSMHLLEEQHKPTFYFLWI